MLKRVCILGAAGKMGSGIALLLLQEMARLEAELTGVVGSGDYRLTLIDTNVEGLDVLKPYLRSQLLKFAERNIIALRKSFAENDTLISNEDMIDYFTTHAMDIIQYDTDVAKVEGARLVFEAIVEDVEIKASLLRTASTHTGPDTLFFTNTSSIPIHILDEKAKLGHRLVGFHFYNPPVVQKLVELIFALPINPAHKEVAQSLAKRLKKIVVVSKDVAGFIGNGHFIREMMYACAKVRELSRVHPLPQALYMVNRITQDFLIRPMGLFQLVDYVGLDVCQKICATMDRYLPGELFQEVFLDEMIREGIMGGQYPDGSQKDGFFRYKGQTREAIYSPLEHTYIPLTGWTEKCDKELGSFPTGHASWKQMLKEPRQKEKLQAYFTQLLNQKTLGADESAQFLLNSRDIARKLVREGVAVHIEDVDTVLKNGFFHLYGSDESWLNLEVEKR